MGSRTRWRWAAVNIAGFFTALCLNGLANALPLNGMTTGALSALYPNLFVPMGATFAIWGVIYTWLLGFVVYGVVLARSSRAHTPLEAIGPWFGVNMLANAGWIVAWHWTQVLVSLVLMGVILGTLIKMYLSLSVGMETRSASAADRWWVHAPISVYLGWITVATIANITALAVALGAPSFGTVPAVLAVGVLVAAVLISASMLWRHRDWLFALVAAWAFFGIYVKRSASDELGSELVASGAMLGLVVLLAGVLLTAGSEWRRRAQAVGAA